jgi:hypothetical protein
MARNRNKTVYSFLLALGLSGLLLSGCVKNTASGFFGPDPVYWTDQHGQKKQVVFTTDYGGSDLRDAYDACDKNWNCYQAYFEANRDTYKKRRGRGQIRLHSRQSEFRTYAEYDMDPWTDKVLGMRCFLNLKFDEQNNIVSADYKK